jgi:hypothetical protein
VGYRGLRSKVAELRHGFDEFWGGILSSDGGKERSSLSAKGLNGHAGLPGQKENWLSTDGGDFRVNIGQRFGLTDSEKRLY